MITTGPYTPLNGQTISATDPAVHTQSSTRCQVQNYSGFSLTVTCNGFNYTCPPYMATTVPTGGQGQGVSIIAAPTVANLSGYIDLVWLLTSDQPPIPDGTLSSSQSVSREVPVTWNNLGGGYWYATIPTLATDQSIFLVMPAVTSGQITITGLPSNIYYANTVFSMNSQTQMIGPYLISGSIDSSVAVNIHLTAGGPPKNFVVFSSNAPLSVATVAGAPLDVVPYGGAQHGTYTGAGAAQLLAAPAAGTSYRVHSVNVYGPAATYLFCRGAVAAYAYAFAVLTVPNTTTLLLNGLLVSDAISVIQNLTTAVNWNIEYDLVTTPSIS